MAERALVVVPTYNEAVNLPSIVPQILAQDPRIDVLIVDDNSPDGTGELADRIAAEEPRVHVLHRPGVARDTLNECSAMLPKRLLIQG